MIKGLGAMSIMSEDAATRVERACFACFHQAGDIPAQAAHAHAVLRLLRTQDGSTTRLYEAVAAGLVRLQLLQQRIVPTVPADVACALPASACIERWTCLVAHGQVMMDNLSYIMLDAWVRNCARRSKAAPCPSAICCSVFGAWSACPMRRPRAPVSWSRPMGRAC
ncbi:MAG: hypothetical protein V4500_12065 [Pseudomonadota bacterium]